MSRKILLQVTAPAVVIGLLLVGVCLASLWSINRLQGNLNTILAENVTSLEAAAELEVKLRQLRFHTFLYVIDATPARLRLIVEDELGFEAALAVAQRTSRQEESALVAKISDGYAQYRATRPEPMDLGHAPRAREDYLTWADAHPVQPLQDECQELMRRNRAAMEDTGRESERVSERARMAMIVLAAVGPLGGLVAGFGIARGLSRTIAQLRVRVEDVRAQLDQDVGSLRVVAGGGLGALDTELGQVLVRVREVVEQAQRRERDALRAEQLAAVGQLAAGVAHEIRNPLVAIKLLIDAALVDGELTSNDLRVIRGEVGRLEQTVTGLLDFARPTPPRRASVDFRAVINAAVGLVRGRAELQNVKINMLAPSDPVLVSVDAAQMQGVIVNLLLNALDAQPGGGRVEVSIVRKGHGVQLRVRDNGPGIAPDCFARLFQPFISSKDTGTGLGLHICRRVVQSHGGDIVAANDPGNGAVFAITLPGGVDDAQTACDR
jgi:two-component system, NtrC family, sensor histidine kinase HydH